MSLRLRGWVEQAAVKEPEGGHIRVNTEAHLELGRRRARGRLSLVDGLEKCPCEPKEGWGVAVRVTGEFTRGLAATEM